MAGRSLRGMAVVAATDRESPAQRLRCPGRRHPPLPHTEGAVPGRPPGPLVPTFPIPRTPEKRLPGARRGHDPEEEDCGLRPREIWEIWRTCSALGDSCSLRTRTRPQMPAHFAAPHPPVEGMGSGGERARTAPAGFPCARARAPSRDHRGPGTSVGHVNFQTAKKVPSIFLLWA